MVILYCVLLTVVMKIKRKQYHQTYIAYPANQATAQIDCDVNNPFSAQVRVLFLVTCTKTIYLVKKRHDTNTLTKYINGS
jgi:hypothetical protein